MFRWAVEEICETGPYSTGQTLDHGSPSPGSSYGLRKRIAILLRRS